jgi:hypothetical protein
LNVTDIQPINGWRHLWREIVRGTKMKPELWDYSGNEYGVVQDLDKFGKWSVTAFVGQTKSGKAENHAAGVKRAQRAIDKALAPIRSDFVRRGKVEKERHQGGQ